MRAEISREGFIRVIAETVAEGFALKHLLKERGENLVEYDYTVLARIIPPREEVINE